MQSPSGWAAEAKVSFLPCYDSSTASQTHEQELNQGWSRQRAHVLISLQ